MMRPTQRAVMAFAAGIPLALFVTIEDPRLWTLSFDYAAVVLIAILIDAALDWHLRRADVRAEAPLGVQIGEHATVRVTIEAAGRRRATRLDAVCEQRGDTDPAQVASGVLRPGTALSLDLDVAPRRRGRVFIDAICVRWRGPLRLIEFTRRIPLNASIDVLPNVRGVRSAALQFFAREAVFGIKVQPQKGEGTEFEALRDYTPGLDSRFIDWKHSARHRKLVCKEFRTERNHSVILCFDTGHLMVEPVEGLPRLDHAINAGLLLGWTCLKSGDLVGLYGFDAAIRLYRQPLSGISSFARLQRATAELDYHHEETNFTLGLAELNGRLKRRALVILFTEFVDTVTAELLIESMQRTAHRHVVVFVTLRDPFLQAMIDATPQRFEDVAKAVIAHDFLRERRVVFERLERLGVHCLEMPSDRLSVGLINRYLIIKQRGII
jgi:uncharacterized protein (DUF58 family)